MNDETQKKDVAQPHDKGYKESLSHPKQFLHFLKKYVKADWMQELTESQLELVDKEFIDKDYEGREADIIYKVLRRDGKSLYIFILQELQSTVDYTMIFRILVYVVNNLLRYFLETSKDIRERKEFRIPAMVPIVFYNGSATWTAEKSLQKYQLCGETFGNHVLNLEYYLVDLSKIQEEDILSTNQVIDNIMYCDKFRSSKQLLEILQKAHDRVKGLSRQEQEEFAGWVSHILLTVCNDKESVARMISDWNRDGVSDMPIEYNIVKVLQQEKEEARAEGRAEGRAKSIIELLELRGEVTEELKDELLKVTSEEKLDKLFRLAASCQTTNEFIERKEMDYTSGGRLN
ncbi:MAG: Rpn family recombination-promoting nuclease/putative transposase [Acetatifactor sp.]|nr:Rpn family recombination-promoting nuclease/putative transposase [Acetatifactor sp.]